MPRILLYVSLLLPVAVLLGLLSLDRLPRWRRPASDRHALGQRMQPVPGAARKP